MTNNVIITIVRDLDSLELQNIQHEVYSAYCEQYRCTTVVHFHSLYRCVHLCMHVCVGTSCICVLTCVS